MKQQDAASAAAKKGIGRLGNRGGSENEVGGTRSHQVAISIEPPEGDDNGSVGKVSDRGDYPWRLLNIDAARFRTGIHRGGEGELIALELPGRSGKATGGHEEPQEGVVQGW